MTLASREARSLYNLVSPGYFQTLGIPVLSGRKFTQQEADTEAPVVVISEATGKRYWPGEDPLGKRISVPKGMRVKGEGRTFTVIGVVKSVRSTNLSKVDPAYVYFPCSIADAWALLVRTDLPPSAAVPMLRDAALGVDQSLATQMLAMNIESGPVQLQRLMSEAPAVVAAVLGGLGLLLASVGIYGVVAYLVSERTREIGLRMALGADRWTVIRLVFRQALRPVAWGIPIGLAGSSALSILLGYMVVAEETPDLLFGVSPWSVSTFVPVLGLFLAIVWLASWIPARRATRIDPAIALRCD